MWPKKKPERAEEVGGPQYVQSMLDQLEETQGQHGVERSERGEK